MTEPDPAAPPEPLPILETTPLPLTPDDTDERGGKPSKGTPADKRKHGKGAKPGPKPAKSKK